MRFIRDLNESELNQIEAALNSDGFEQIHRSDKCFEFRKGFRTFKLYSTDILSEDDDLGLMADFDHEAFLENSILNPEFSKSWKNIKPYAEKTRHSVSFEKKHSEFADEKQAMDELGWVWKDSHRLENDPNWNAELYTTEVHHVLITGKDHIIINGHVYEGTPEQYLSMGRFDKLSFFEKTHTFSVLNSLNQSI